MDLPLLPPVKPMLAKAVTKVPTAEGTFYEPKWDGFRCIVFRDGDEVELGSRNERPMTRYFPEVVEAIKANTPERCVLDGEIIVARGDRLDFDALLLGLYRDDGSLQHVGVTASFPMSRRRELLDEIAPYRLPEGGAAAAGHPWGNWADAQAHVDRRMPGNVSRWNAGKDLSFVPPRAELVIEVAYDQMEGDRFRHTAQFRRWRTDRDPASCTYEQLEEPVSYDLADVLTARPQQ